MKKSNRVYGVIGIGAYMSNFNADFSGYPKTTTNNTIFGSDKALKYPMKKMWQLQGENVLYIKSLKINSDKKSKDNDAVDKIQPRDLNERFTQLFGSLDEKSSSPLVLGKLFSAIDVMNFGATFAEKGQNISITGAIQINQGFNKFENTNVLTQEILSPFRNSNAKGEEALATTIGSKIMTDEAHYVYGFSVNPHNYDDFVGLAENFDGYTQEAFDQFKIAAKVATTAFNTNSKSGCENEFSLFVELVEGSKLFLANLDQYITIKKDDIITYDLTNLEKLLEASYSEIKSIEIYANPVKVKVVYTNLPCTVASIF